MSIEWNPNAEAILAAMVKRVQDALASVVDDYLGRPVDEIRPVLEQRWADANEGAKISEPELTTVATMISNGKRVWVEDDGRIMAED